MPQQPTRARRTDGTDTETTTTETMNLDINIFGDLITDETLIQAPDDYMGEHADPPAAIAAALEQLTAFIDWNNIDTVTTGVHDPEHTDILEEALERIDADVELDVFFFKFKNFLDDEDVDGRNQAYAKATRRRNEYLLEPDNKYPDADALIRITDGGISGEEYTRNGVRENVPVITLSVSKWIDWDNANTSRNA